jgi:hypothetical protein
MWTVRVEDYDVDRVVISSVVGCGFASLASVRLININLIYSYPTDLEIGLS